MSAEDRGSVEWDRLHPGTLGMAASSSVRVAGLSLAGCMCLQAVRPCIPPQAAQPEEDPIWRAAASAKCDLCNILFYFRRMRMDVTPPPKISLRQEPDRRVCRRRHVRTLRSKVPWFPMASVYPNPTARSTQRLQILSQPSRP